MPQHCLGHQGQPAAAQAGRRCLTASLSHCAVTRCPRPPHTTPINTSTEHGDGYAGRRSYSRSRSRSRSVSRSVSRSRSRDRERRRDRAGGSRDVSPRAPGAVDEPPSKRSRSMPQQPQQQQQFPLQPPPPRVSSGRLADRLGSGGSSPPPAAAAGGGSSSRRAPPPGPGLSRLFQHAAKHLAAGEGERPRRSSRRARHE